MKLEVNLNSNIWEDNPLLKVKFYSFYKNDKSKDKTVSDQIMKVIYFMNHPDSEMRDLLEEQLIEDLTNAGFLKIKWDRDKYIELEILFNAECLTVAERVVKNWENKLKERDEFMLGKPYNESNYDMLDKMMANTQKLWSFYFQALSDLSKEREEQTSGNLVESAAELGDV